MGQSIDKETLQALREERKYYIERARKAIKENNKVFKAIREQIAAQPRTVPQIAQALAMDTAKVLLFVAALKKYGEVMEGPKDGDYFSYGLVSSPNA
jgi:predicted Rossmann fold nucleotide-binding protein DprA/Smf involved in DNA uptake